MASVEAASRFEAHSEASEENRRRFQRSFDYLEKQARSRDLGCSCSGALSPAPVL